LRGQSFREFFRQDSILNTGNKEEEEIKKVKEIKIKVNMEEVKVCLTSEVLHMERN